MSKHLPRDAISACRCLDCGKHNAYHRMGCTYCRGSNVEHGFFMPPDMGFVSNTGLLAQGYVGDDEPTESTGEPK